MKKILILYASAGSGHKKAAQAIESAAGKIGLQTCVADVASYMSSWSRRLYCEGYLFLISRLPGLWGLLYFLSDAPALKIFNVHLRRFCDGIMCRRLTGHLMETKPDVVISTQFLTSEIVAVAKAKYGLASRLITVVTDFGVHNFWVNPGTDMYACASLATKQSLLQKGIPEHQICVTGIPLDEKFKMPQTRESICDEMHFDKNKFTVLIATGGIGIGPIEDVVDRLKDDVQLFVVCGSNKNLYDKLSKKNYENVRVFGFVDFMQKLMKASDVIVTKAGGLTVTESLAMGLPMIFFFLIPGQEGINARTMAREGAGFIAKSSEEIKQLVLVLKNTPSSLAARRAKVLGLARPDACQRILSLINP